MLTVRLATLDHQETNRVAAAVSGERLLVPSLAGGLLAGAADLPLSLKTLLSVEGALDRLGAMVTQVETGGAQLIDALDQAGALVAEAKAQFRAPIPDPAHFMGCGLAYRQHLEEMGGVPAPANPVLFLCSPVAISAHRDPIVLPAHQGEMVDYEGELAIVIGRPCYNVTLSEAMDYVAGYMAHNDISARDHTAEVAAVTVPVKMLGAWSRNVGGKQHPGFSPMGPFLVTRDEVPDPHALHLTVRVNGKLVQDVTTDDLIFTVAQYVSYVSQWYALCPGDIISTGSPAGVGVAKRPPVFLQDGDIVTVNISGIGTLSNTVVSHSGGTSGRLE
jgi:acylpyruvate hydrolase